MRSRRSVRALASAGAVTLAAVAAASCSSSGSPAPGLGYVVDGSVPTYNVGSTEGLASAAAQAFVRVQTGFSYPGPHGETIADTDFGTVTPVPGDATSIEYRINPAAVYSDGAPVVCDDMVLAWAARNGRIRAPGADGAEVPLFDAPVDPAMAQIASIDCTPGSREAVVHYTGERAVTDWRSAFAATSMLPSHVVAQGAAGIPPGAGLPGSGPTGTGAEDGDADAQTPGPDGGAVTSQPGIGIVDAVTNGDTDALRAIAQYWNTAFTLAPGTVDPHVFVSSGPYRLDAVDEDGSLELVANDRWWGDAPRTGRITVHPRSASVNTLARDGDADVVSIGAGAKDDLSLGSGFSATTAGTDDVEQLVFGIRGDLASAAARRAVASCIPRAQLAADAAAPAAPAGAEVAADTTAAQAPLDSRSTLQGAPGYGFIAATAGGRYTATDADAVRSALAEAGLDGLTVRVGYRAPDARRAQTVAAMAKACAPLGIQIHDSSSAGFTPSALRDGTVDAVLGGTGGAQSGPPRGPASAVARLTALSTGAAGDIGGYSNGRIDEIVAQLRVTAPGTDALTLTREAEDILWRELPTLPLYATPRETALTTSLHGGAPSASWAGAGWNMDRWMVLQ